MCDFQIASPPRAVQPEPMECVKCELQEEMAPRLAGSGIGLIRHGLRVVSAEPLLGGACDGYDSKNKRGSRR